MQVEHDLLDQSDRLLGTSAAGIVPSEADLRRAISNAYYSVFHLLVNEALTLLCPARPKALRAAMRRGFQHSAMNSVCRSVAHGRLENLVDTLKPVFADPIEREIASVAKAFARLQGKRHVADYALDDPISFGDASAIVQEAKDAFSDWHHIKGSDNAQAFLVSLLLSKQWRTDHVLT